MMRGSQLLYNSRIHKVRFNIAGTEEILQSSYVPITTYDLFRNNQPYPNGMYDGHLGTTDHSYRCQTCYNNKKNCLGHEGHYILNYPIMSPICINEIRKWLKLICFECGKPIIAESTYAKFPANKRLDEAQKIARTGNRKCVHCKTPHPTIRKDILEPLGNVAEWYEDKRKVREETIFPHKIKQYFERIADSDVVKLGKSVLSHPRNFVVTAIKIPPTSLRPDVKKVGGGRSGNDDITTMLQIIIKKNETIPPVLPAEIDPKLRKALFDLSNAFYDLIKAGGDSAMNSIDQRLRGKQGRFRKTMEGKRVWVMCRSTIVGDITLKINEIGVPLTFAKTVQMAEVVQDYNRNVIMQYINNGRKHYPGATKLVKKNTLIEYSIENIHDVEIENGDILYRDMINGDAVYINRQPSLKPSNISCVYAVVCTDPKVLVLRINVNSCPLYDADFDGDAMNLIVVSSEQGRSEISLLGGIDQWLINHNSSTSIGQVDDSIIGNFQLTLSGVNFDKYHAMMLFNYTSILPDFSEIMIGAATTSGRDLVSKLFTEMPINFTRNPTYYKENMSQWVRYDPSDIKVKFERGKHVSGVLDSASIGKKAIGGIYHLVANEYGPNRALELMYNMQQLAVAYNMQHGYTIGVNDLRLSPPARNEVSRIAADIINKSNIITSRLQNGEIIPPIGMTVEEAYEAQQIQTLMAIDDFMEPILSDIDTKHNNLFKFIMSGSKGALENLFNMISAIGQKLINGERIRPKFGHKRTLPYFPRFDTSPESRGYITNSYVQGMTSYEYVFNAMNARFDFISKALSTSVTGEQNRKSIKNLESILVNNLRFATKNHNIIQFAYGEDYLDPRRVEKVKFPTVMISDEELESKYRHVTSEAANAIFDTEFAAIKADRNEYRKIFMQIEAINTNELMNDERRMPVNVDRIINDTLSEYSDISKTPDDKQVLAMVETVNNLCVGIPYVLINEIQERLKTPVPEQILAATRLLTMLIRSHLYAKNLIKLAITPDILDIIADKIRLKYARALISPGTAVGIIAAQSFSAPLTQYMLDAHHRSAAGGTSTDTLVRVKEVLGARDVHNLAAPSMIIPVISAYAHNKAKVTEIANNIEVMKLKQFTALWQIFFEKYAEIVHPRYVHESKMIQEFMTLNPLLAPPGDLIRWCIRIVINKTTLILKNMSLELIVNKLHETFPELYIVYTPENAPEIVLRIYIRSSLKDTKGNLMFKGHIEHSDIIYVKDLLLDMIIRGVDGIINTSVVQLIRNKIQPNGSIARDNTEYVIKTTGTNLVGILANKFVDPFRVQTDAILETQRMFGIEAARQKIITELRKLVDTCNHRHYTIYADEMTSTGKVTPIERSGLGAREANNYLLRIGFSAPIQTLEEAGINAAVDNMTGITAPLLVGTIPRVGTLYNSLHSDAEMIHAHVKKPDDVFELL